MSRYRAQAAFLGAYYAHCLARSGTGPGGVDWSSRARQQVRFAALLDVLALEGLPAPTVLDVGCGLGDLWPVLAARCPDALYTGYDLSEPHLAEARLRHPAAAFVEGDAFDLLRAARRTGQVWDCVVASGTLNVRVPRWERWSWDLVEAMWDVTRHTLAFNVLSNAVQHPPAVVAVDAAAWLARCRALSPRAYQSDGYLPGDVTFALPRS